MDLFSGWDFLVKGILKVKYLIGIVSNIEDRRFIYNYIYN